jgi:hypothetical protein
MHGITERYKHLHKSLYYGWPDLLRLGTGLGDREDMLYDRSEEKEVPGETPRVFQE